MTREELKRRCLELATSGDAQAAATLAVVHELENARFIIANLVGSLNLAVSLKLVDPADGQYAERSRLLFPKLADAAEVEKLKKIILEQPLPPLHTAAALTSSEPLQRVQTDGSPSPKPGVAEVVGKLMGFSSPEEVAAAATRKAQGLPEVQDPAATGVSTQKPAGHYDKSSKMGEPSSNREE